VRFIRIVALCGALGVSTSARAQVPLLEHVVVVIMENHSYDQVRVKPYVASLIAASSVCTESYAVTHPSLPNYLALVGRHHVRCRQRRLPGSGLALHREQPGPRVRGERKNLAIVL
jgi:hypothetical protein